MAHAANVLNSLVPITQFNRGQAARIFDRLHSESQLVVLKNNQPAAVILSPSEYQRLSEIEEDYLLLREAMERLSANTAPTTPMVDMMRELGITEEALDAAEDVEIE
ncbi:MAG: type II toxin-antitoxin system Phd/YefM family antitoxin [Oscillospiraceae bacterium]|nr:type II toxin-antitoxin system Phd/YefM family antitoxin [Oscillospiraceae bacterium]